MRVMEVVAHGRMILLIVVSAAVAGPRDARADAPAAAPARVATSATRPAVRPATPLPPGVVVRADVEYVPNGGPSRTLDLYLPPGAGRPVPLVIWVHGGAWRGGSKAGEKGLFVGLLGRGYAVASINYRLSGEAPFPAQIYDCKAAVRYLRAHAKEHHVDPDRIGAWGGSAGGHLAALLGTGGGVKELDGDEGAAGVSSRVQAVCDWYGPSDLLTAYAQGTTDVKNAPDSHVTRLLGGPFDQKKDVARQASPVVYVSKDAPPFLIMHGDQDPLVPPAQSDELRDALAKAGVPVELIKVKGAKHGGPLFQTPGSLTTVYDFFDRALKPGGGAVRK